MPRGVAASRFCRLACTGKRGVGGVVAEVHRHSGGGRGGPLRERLMRRKGSTGLSREVCSPPLFGGWSRAGAATGGGCGAVPFTGRLMEAWTPGRTGVRPRESPFWPASRARTMRGGGALSFTGGSGAGHDVRALRYREGPSNGHDEGGLRFEALRSRGAARAAPDQHRQRRVGDGPPILLGSRPPSPGPGRREQGGGVVW